MRVLVIPDKFKGTLSAGRAARAIARGWQRARPKDKVTLLPMTDGGDGFGRVMSGLLGARERKVTTVDAAHQSRRARWWWDSRSATAIVESAQVIGLAGLPHGRYHPFDLDTAGLGTLLAAVERAGPRRCLIGIGGSATNDGGFGLAKAIGWRFVTAEGDAISSWRDLTRCEAILPPTRRLALGELLIALDVQNPLLGVDGCTRVYGPQKGMGAEDFEEAEEALRRLTRVMGAQGGALVACVPGAGAAGGLGFGLMAFLGALPTKGFDLFADTAGLAERLRECGLVITGEGRLDRQSLMGKGVGELAGLCADHGVPCIAIAGASDLGVSEGRLFAEIHSLSELADPDEALARPGHWLARTTVEAARSFVPA